MVLEGFLGIELDRIREHQYRTNAAAWRSSSEVPNVVRVATMRRRVGDAFIRAGGRIAGVIVEPCLDAERQVSPIRS